MRAFNHGGRIFRLLLAGLLCASSVPNRLLADDKDSSNPPSKSAPAKSDASKMEAPAPLTERERWLLDRVEQLEKRVAELETKSNSPATATAAPFSQPGSLSPTASSVAASAAGVPPAPTTEAIANVIPAEKALASVSPQALESMISTIPKTIRSAGRAKSSGPMKSR